MVTVNGAVAQLVADGFNLAGVALTEGTNTIVVDAKDPAGNSGSDTITVTLDTVPPVITVTAPLDHQFVNDKNLAIQGSVDGAVASLTINGQPAHLNSTGFDYPLVLTPGPNSITLTATDPAGNSATKTLIVTLDAMPPIVAITTPVSGLITRTAQATVSGTVSKPNCSAVVNGTPITLTNQAFAFSYVLGEGDNTLTLEATDKAGNKGSASILAILDTQPPVLAIQAPSDAPAGANVVIAVNSSDNSQLTLVELKADGVPFWSGGNAPALADEVTYRLSPSLNAGSEVLFQLRGIDSAGNEVSAVARTLISQASIEPGYIQGKVLDDQKGLLLEGADVTVNDAKGGVTTLTTAVDGGYFLETAAGSVQITIAKPGFTTVERILPVMPQQKGTALDARLTKISDTKNLLDEAGGVVHSAAGSAPAGPAVALTMPAGALPAQADLRLTPVSNQGLAGLLPAGWSPLAAADVRLLDPAAGDPLDISFAVPATIRFPLSPAFALPQGTTLTVATYDTAAHQWVARGNAVGAADGSNASAEIPGVGQYALLLPDPSPSAPPDAETGKPILPATMTTVATASMATSGKVVPQSAPPVAGLKAAGEVVVAAREGADSPPQFTSGLVLNSRITERFDLKSGDKVETATYSQDIVLYRAPCSTSIGAGSLTAPLSGDLRATFPVSPSREYTIVDLLLGKVSLAIVRPEAADSGVMVGADGGRLVDADGNILVIPAGALARTVPVATKNGAPAAGAVGSDFTLIKAVEVNLTRQTLGQSATLSIAAPDGFNPALPVVVARQIDVKGAAKLKLVALAKQTGSLIGSDMTAAGIALPGIVTSGTYYFLQAKGPIGFVAGTVFDAGNAPFTGALVGTDSGSLVDLSTSAGRYLLAAPVASFTATALDIYKNDAGSAAGAIAAAGQAVFLDIRVVMIPPTVVSITPANGAASIHPGAAVVVVFSKAMDRNSIDTATLKLAQADGSAVPGVFSFGIDGATVTFSPAAGLQSQASYTLTLAAAIRDLQGYPLGSVMTSGFTIRNTTPPPMPAAGSITASFPDADAFITVTATQGSAPTDVTVLLVNDTSGEIVSIAPATNGSFTGKVRAQLGDQIKVVLMDNSGNQTVVSYLIYKSDDGKYLVTAKGGKVEGEGGSVLEIPDGALVGPTVVKIAPVIEENLPHPVPGGGKFLGAVNVDTSGLNFQKEVHLSIPVPADMPADATPFLAQPRELTNPDGTVEKVYVIIDSAKIINGRITTASPPFDGVMTFGLFAFVYFDPMGSLGGPVIFSGTTYRDMDGVPGYTQGVDQPIQGAVIRAPGAENYVSFSNSTGHYATYGFTANGVCRSFPVTAIHPLTMNRVTVNLTSCDGPYIVNNFNFKLADKDTMLPDKTPPTIDINLKVASDQGPAAIIVAGTVPVGTDLLTDINATDQLMGTITLSMEYIAVGATASSTTSIQVNRTGNPISIPVAAGMAPLFRYVYQPQFDIILAGSQPYYFRPVQPGIYKFVVTATDYAGNTSMRTIQIRAVPQGTDLGTSIDGYPTVDAVVPADEALDVMVTASIVAYFSEPVNNVTSATFKLIDTATGLAVPASVYTSIEGGRMQATLTPQGNLFYGRKYNVILTSGIKDNPPNPSAPPEYAPPNGDGSLPLKDGFSSTFTTKVPKAYDLASDQFTGSRDIDLYTDPVNGNTYAYITAGENGWRAVDVTDPTYPSVVFSKNQTNSGVSWSFRSVTVHPEQARGLLAMTEDIRYNDGNQYGYIRFYDIKTNPENPTIIGREKLSEAYSGIPGRVVMQGDYAYVATVGAGLQVVSIEAAKEYQPTGAQSNGSAIVGVLDSIGQGYGSPNDVVAYSRTRGILTTNPGYFLTLDLATPEFPEIIASFKPDGYSFTRVAVAREFSYTDSFGNISVMDLAVTGSREGKVNTVNLSDPYNPVIIGTAKDEQGNDVSTIVMDITVSKDVGLAFVTTYNSIQVFDVKNPKNPRLLNTITQLPDPSGAVDANGNPVLMPLGETPAIVEKGGWVYLANQTRGMRVLDLDPVQINMPKSLLVMVNNAGVPLREYDIPYTVNLDGPDSCRNLTLEFLKDDNSVIPQGTPLANLKGDIKISSVGNSFDLIGNYRVKISCINQQNEFVSAQTYIALGQLSILDAKSKKPMQGAVTDDTSRLELKLTVGENYDKIGSPVLEIFNSDDGTITIGTGSILVDGNIRSSAELKLNKVENTAQAQVIYKVPDKFVRFGTNQEADDKERAERSVQLKLNGESEGLPAIRLRRPQLVLVHGLWGSPVESWDGFVLTKDIGNNLYDPVKVDYKATNADAVAINSIKIKPAIKDKDDDLMRVGILPGKYDVVVHSMGGLLLRDLCNKDSAYCENRFRKIITVDTPHKGSKLANLILEANAKPDSDCYKEVLVWVNKNKKIWDSNGNINKAFVDLAVGSDTLTQLPDLSTALNWTAVAGLSDDNWLVLLTFSMSRIATKIMWYEITKYCGVTLNNTLTLENDQIVSKESQLGSALYQRVIRDENHLSIIESADLSAELKPIIENKQ